METGKVLGMGEAQSQLRQTSPLMKEGAAKQWKRGTSEKLGARDSTEAGKRTSVILHSCGCLQACF